MKVVIYSLTASAAGGFAKWLCACGNVHEISHFNTGITTGVNASKDLKTEADVLSAIGTVLLAHSAEGKYPEADFDLTTGLFSKLTGKKT